MSHEWSDLEWTVKWEEEVINVLYLMFKQLQQSRGEKVDVKELDRCRILVYSLYMQECWEQLSSMETDDLLNISNQNIIRGREKQDNRKNKERGEGGPYCVLWDALLSVSSYLQSTISIRNSLEGSKEMNYMEQDEKKAEEEGERKSNTRALTAEDVCIVIQLAISHGYSWWPV